MDQGRGKKPLIVGVQHDALLDSQKAKLEQERQRVRKIIDALPPGEPIGVEITPRLLASSRDPHARGRRDLFDEIISYADQTNHPVVPLDSESRYHRHGEAIKKYYGSTTDIQALLLGSLHRALSESHASGISPERKKFLMYSSLRSLDMGIKAHRKQLAVSFLGNAHAHDLKYALRWMNVFNYSLSGRKKFEPYAKKLAKHTRRRFKRIVPTPFDRIIARLPWKRR